MYVCYVLLATKDNKNAKGLNSLKETKMQKETKFNKNKKFYISVETRTSDSQSHEASQNRPIL